MKAAFYCLISVLLIIASSCKKDRFKGIYYGAASVNINGMSWKTDKVRCGINQPCYKGSLGLEISRYNDQGYLRETISFHKLPASTGQKTVFSFNYQNACNDTLDGTYYTSTADGDVGLASYNASATGDNYINIERYNERTGELSGTFNVTYVIFTRRDPDSPDTVRITNGKFKTKILN